MANTVTIGYIGMGSCYGWKYSLKWQDYMFRKVDEGYTFKEAFDLASAKYPAIAPCVKFVGDEKLKIENPPAIPEKPHGVNIGKINTEYAFSTISWDPDDDVIYYKFDWGDGNSTNWIGPFLSYVNVSASHSWQKYGVYEVKVKAKDAKGLESNWSSPLEVNIINDITPPSVNITAPLKGYLYIQGYKIGSTLFGRTILIGKNLIWVEAADDTLMDRVEFYIDDKLKYVDNGEPPLYSWQINEPLFGRHVLKVVAYDWFGNSASQQMLIWIYS